MSQPGREREREREHPNRHPASLEDADADAAGKKNGFDVDICDMAEYGEGNGVRLELNEDQLRNAFLE